jgi:anti-sigma factor RsiW
MFCDEALDAIEAIAAGDMVPDGRVASHLGSCPNCASALAHARTLEKLLQRRTAPRAPAQFTARTLTRVRRARWRNEQFVDTAFNAAIGLVVLSIVVGIWMLLERTGIVSIGHEAIGLMRGGLLLIAQRVGPTLPLYVGAAALLGVALVVWWWAERAA